MDKHAATAIETVVSELVSNVVQHTNGGGTVRAWTERPFHLEVSDNGTMLQEQRPIPHLVGGHGLDIVEELTEDWGILYAPHHGKTIWADFDETGLRWRT